LHKGAVRQRITYNFRDFALLYIAWWLAWALVQVFVLHRMEMGWRISVTDAALSNSLLAVMCLGVILLFRSYQPGGSRRVYLVLFVVVATAIYTDALNWLLSLLHRDNAAYQVFLDKSLPVRFVFALLMLSFVSVNNWLLNTLEEQSRYDKRRNEAEQLAREAELVKLRQQLQPHFLFNSLNSISALVGTRPEEARKMIQQLSDFLRGTLKKDEQQTVSLKEELHQLQLYLGIEKVRFGDRLTILVEVAPGCEQALLPPLLLQPIVENAIKFGLYGTTDNITISVSTKISDNHLIAEVRNPFDADLQSSSGGTGFGLSSVQRRLLLLYGRNDLFVTEKKDKLFVARIKIPQTTGNTIA